MRTFLCLFFVILNIFTTTLGRYVLPDCLIEPLKPKGLRVSMPVTPSANIQLFGFHANVNKPIRGKEEGEISRSSTRPVNGNWVITDDEVELRVGDRINYWVFAQSNRLGYDKEDQSFVVTELYDRNAENCLRSESLVNNDETICVNNVIFQDEFKSRTLDESKWEVLKFSPQYGMPGREFVSYENKRENVFIENGALNIKATIRGQSIDDLLQFPLDLRNGCSVDDNEQACLIEGKNSYELLPPVKSARIRSKYAFRYGRVEVEAKLPIGDWLVPHIVLEPRDFKYGPYYRSGELYVAFARGNLNLKANDEEIGAKALYCGPSVTDDDRTKNMHKQELKQPWGSAIRTYTLEFSSEGISCMVETRVVWNYKYPNEGFKSNYPNLDYARNKWISKSAPFDQYYHLTIGLSAGGSLDFPDETYPHYKPWDNSDPRAPEAFANNQSSWERTWGDDSSLKIYKARVYAI